MASTTQTDTGVHRFLRRYASDPERLAAVLVTEFDLVSCAADHTLCRAGDEADCVWIVEDGEFGIRTSHKFTSRGLGEIVGEAAFFRLRQDGGPARRGADVVATKRSKAWRIDRAVLDGLDPECRAMWLEAICSALVAKLDEATEHRAALTGEVGDIEDVIGRFVCSDGVQAALGAMRVSIPKIRPVKKHVVAWFSDISGFSAHAVGLEPAATADAVELLMEPQVRAISAAGGQVDKFLGDGLMAWWPAMDEARLAKAANAAAMAALASVEEVRRIASENGFEMGLRIGLHLGEAVVGDFGAAGRSAYTIIGETVNAASRYEQYKPKDGQPDGPVRISDRVYGRLHADGRSRFSPDPFAMPDKHGRTYPAHFSIA
ncbi:adenylate/guanylate cyclase domain-containing protein [Methylobacterium sp. 77]|uniref:adenylate/guanylate cyclase domain-containing protein n=1 Tax=Methylobacterium sp. 77 TaxID=1101192 RepID=UPI000378D468|nr:adenylate/guanylate cyclase domain-containing protein [Methylobacterium sp. 77]